MPIFGSWLQFYRNLRIKHKLLILIAFMMAISYVVTYMALQYAYSIYDTQIYEKSSQVLNLSSNGIENELRKIEKFTFQLITDPTVQQKLSEIKGKPEDYTAFKHRTDLLDRLVQYAGEEKYVYSVGLFPAVGDVLNVGRTTVWPEPLMAEIKSRAEQGMGEMNWIYQGEPEPALLSVRLIRSFAPDASSLSLETLGVLVVRIRMDRIVEDVASGTELNKGEFLIAADRKLIYPMGEAQGAPEIPSALQEGRAYEIRNVNGHKLFISHVQTGYTGWTYYSQIPFDTIFERIIWMKNLLIAVFAGSLAVVFILSVRFAKSITGPIEKLIGRMKQVQKGDFTHPVPADHAAWNILSKDEVGQLHRTFRVMVQQIDELITENYAKQLTIKEAQFKALQAQINPHFLYNTLESINWEAKMNGQTRISRMVEALGFLLRSSINQKQSIVTLGQELDIIRHYLTIQKFRFEERLNVHLDIPANLHSCPIPKLILQPLVENAIHHAVEMMVDPCTISIRAAGTDDGVVVEVEDDGPGMTPELLLQVQSGEVQSKGNGIGLSNIRDRIVLAFGEPYGLRIDSAPGAGAKVSVYIPYERRDPHV